MSSTRTTSLRILTVFVLAIALVFPAAAFAEGRGNVPNNAYFKGQKLQGFREVDVKWLIETQTKAPALNGFAIKGAGKVHGVSAAKASSAVHVNVEAMVAQAYSTGVSATTTYTIQPVYSVDRAKVAPWVTAFAKKADHKPVNATHYAKKRTLKIKAGRIGTKVNQSATITSIARRLVAEANGAPATEVWASVKETQAKVNSRNIGKAILVSLKQRKVYLYNGAKVQKKYRCAIGTPGHPTPTGSFKIVAKRNRPTWVNPDPNGWGANMPARIAPGPRNPLGTRALNLNASGIRMHGTYKVGSIGRAASHGCMRMLRKDIEDLYKRVSVGTPVIIVK